MVTAEQRLTIDYPVVILKLPNAHLTRETVTAAGFDENQPRDRVGRWADDDFITDGGDEAASSFDYLDDDEALAMHREMQGDEPWTPEQHEALSDYAGTLYQEINGMQRYPDEVSGAARKELQKLTDEISAAMRPTTRDSRTSRWIGAPDVFGVYNVNTTSSADIVDALSPLRGKRFREPGFLSTSTQEDWLREDFDDRENAIAVEIDVPKGTPAAYLGGRGGPGIRGESELLLNLGREVELVDVFLRDDIPTVRLRVVS